MGIEYGSDCVENVHTMNKNREPLDSPVSEDQSDLPLISQAMPLYEADMLARKTTAVEDPIGVILTASELAELRVLKARQRRAQDDIDAFWHKHLPGGIPGRRQG